MEYQNIIKCRYKNLHKCVENIKFLKNQSKEIKAVIKNMKNLQ